MRVVCVLLREPERLVEFAELCLRFSPQITIGEKALFMEIEGCKKLYSEDSLIVRLRVLLRRFKLSGRIVIDSDMPTAMARAYFNLGASDALPIEALAFYHSPLKLSPALDDTILALKRLGVDTIEKFKKLPRRAIAVKFGKDGLVALHHLDHAAQIPWVRFKAPEKILEFEEVDESYVIRNFEPAVFLLKSVLDRAMLRLRAKGLQVAALRFSIDQEVYSIVEKPRRDWLFQFSFPQSSVLSLLSIIRERVEFELQRDGLESPICRIEIEIVQSVYGQHRQRDFFSKKEEEEEAFRGILARLTERLGLSRVFFAAPQESYFPERSWRKTLEEPVAIPIPVPERPLRILKRPVSLGCIDNILSHGSRRWKVVEMTGPERLSGDWWVHDLERDYFRVLTDCGEELWVYATAAAAGANSGAGVGQLFLHGIFD